MKRKLRFPDLHKPIISFELPEFSKIIKFKNRAGLLKSNSKDICNHTSHKQCVLCGAMEFALGLVVGVVLALMFAKTFF